MDQKPSRDGAPSRMGDGAWLSIWVLLPRSGSELLERILGAGTGLLTVVTVVALLRGASLATLGLLGAAVGLLALAGAIVGALRPETALVDALIPDRPGAHTLPAEPTQFVGRRRRIAQALRFLRRQENEAGVLTVTGMPGVGKTALATVVAHLLSRTSYPDNQLFIHLGGGRQPVKSSMAALHEALVQWGVPAAEIPTGLEERRNLYRQMLLGTRSLVVLDDASEAQQVIDLWPPDGSAVIVTCRVELLRAIANGARPIRLRPLTTLQALRLLANRIGRWRVARQPVAALRLVGLYGRLPLAVESVAARLTTASGRRLSLRAVLGQLQDWRTRLAFASIGADYGVALALDVSYKGLTKEQQRAFLVFGLLDLPELDEEVVATVLLVTPERARELLSQLVDAGLLEVAGRSGDRWQAHELVRAYASVIVSELHEEERPELVRRAVAVYLGQIRTLKQLLPSPVAQPNPLQAALARVRLERALVRPRQLATRLVEQAARIGLDLTPLLAEEPGLAEIFTNGPAEDDTHPGDISDHIRSVDEPMTDDEAAARTRTLEAELARWERRTAEA